VPSTLASIGGGDSNMVANLFWGIPFPSNTSVLKEVAGVTKTISVRETIGIREAVGGGQ